MIAPLKPSDNGANGWIVVDNLTVPASWPTWDDPGRLEWVRGQLSLISRTADGQLGAVRATLIAQRHLLNSRISYQKRAATLAGVARARFFDSQGGKCAICGAELTVEGAHLDHDHSCCDMPPGRACGGCFRGLLCGRCNTGLGLFRDDSEVLRSAITYLEVLSSPDA